MASLGAGFADNGTELILWRILQGIGGSFLFANSAAIVTDAFPREQLGLAMGTNTMVAAVGLVIGPVLGGALVAISWHWVFWFNVPFALAGQRCGRGWSCTRSAGAREDRSFDALGTITFLIGLTGLVYGISKGGISGWTRPLGDRRPGRRGGVPAGVRADREPHPRADARPLDLPEPPVLGGRRGAAFINGLARFALMFVFVFYFQGVQGDSPILAGVKLAPLARRDADRLAAGRDLGRPPRLAR